jgi:hypothetical protein
LLSYWEGEEVNQQQPKNHQLTDLFRTAIAAAAPAPGSQPPSIVVNGSHNVISWGGTVYMADAEPKDSQLEM